MVGIPFHNQTVHPEQSKRSHNRIQVGGAVVCVGGEQNLAAGGQIFLQHADFIHRALRTGEIAGGTVDDEKVAVLGNGAAQQVQLLRLDVLGLQGIHQGVRQGPFPVVGGVVGLAGFPAGQAVQRRGDLLFAVKADTIIVIVGVVVDVKVHRVQHIAASAGVQNQAAARDLLCPILRGKGGIQGGVLLFPVNVAAGSCVLVQQPGDDGIFAAGFTQIVDGYILGQALRHLDGSITQGVQAALRQVELGICGGDGLDNQIDEDHQHHGRRQDGGGVQAIAEDAPAVRRCGKKAAQFGFFVHRRASFQFQRRFSMPCAVKKRNSPATLM